MWHSASIRPAWTHSIFCCKFIWNGIPEILLNGTTQDEMTVSDIAKYVIYVNGHLANGMLNWVRHPTDSHDEFYNFWQNTKMWLNMTVRSKSTTLKIRTFVLAWAIIGCVLSSGFQQDPTTYQQNNIRDSHFCRMLILTRSILSYTVVLWPFIVMDRFQISASISISLDASRRLQTSTLNLSVSYARQERLFSTTTWREISEIHFLHWIKLLSLLKEMRMQSVLDCFIYDIVDAESRDSSSTSLTEDIEVPNLEESELKLLMVPMSERKAELTWALLFGAVPSLDLNRRLSRVHLIATPIKMMILSADRHMAAMVPPTPTPTDEGKFAVRDWTTSAKKCYSFTISGVSHFCGMPDMCIYPQRVQNKTFNSFPQKSLSQYIAIA